MIDSGDTGFMIICTALVLLMTPGLAFFYGGMVRRKNVVNTMMTSIFVIGAVLISVVPNDLYIYMINSHRYNFYRSDFNFKRIL